MTNFTIKCETFVRLANVCAYFSPRVDEELKEKINVIRLENHKGSLLAIVTNQAVACVERIGDTSEPDDVVDVRIDHTLLTQLKQEALYGSFLNVSTIPQLATSTCSTTMGWQYPNCCAWHDDSPLNKWRDWGIENADMSVGEMYWDLDEVETLFKASPTGKIVFPEFIDVNKPVTLRDRYSENWVGLFIPKPNIGEKVTQKAQLPKWWKK